MKKFVLFVACMFMMLFVFAQTDFQKLTLDKALEQAATENKRVFVDCYTVWCGPCKMMAEKILPLKEVGEFLNDHFVCLKIDMEKGEGVKIARKYKVTAYPTFLILKADGSLQHRIVGGAPTGKEFLDKVEEGMEGSSLGDLEMQYQSGNREFGFQMTYIKALVRSNDVEKARTISRNLLESLDEGEKCSALYWYIYENEFLSPVGEENMTFLLNHVEEFRAGVGKERVDAKLVSLFEMQLEDILRGRNQEVTLADVEAAEKLLDSYHLVGQDNLIGYIHLIKAVLTEDTEETLRLCKEIYPKMPDEKIAYLYFNPVSMLQNKWSEKQKKELVVLTKKLMNQVEMSQLKHSLKSFAEVGISPSKKK